MKLALQTREGVRICDWESYGLLRDNVQHFLENGTPQARFGALHAIERAVDARTQRIDAARLRGEVLRAWAALGRKNLEEAAISPRTRAVPASSPERPANADATTAGDTCWALPIKAAAETPIPKAAGRFVSAVLTLTTTAEDGDWLHVRRIGEAPTFARTGDANP